MKNIKTGKKITSQKKGSILESVLQDMMKRVVLEWDSEPLKNRIQTSGTQFGKDGIYNWIDNKTKQEFFWSIEAKNHGDNKKIGLISGDKLKSKVVDFYSSNTSAECWCVFSPFGKVDNSFEEYTGSDRFPFKIVLWTSTESIERRLACFPDLYKKIYGKDTPVVDKTERENIINAWKQETLTCTLKGKHLKENFGVKNNLEISKIVKESVNSAIAKELDQKTVELKVYKNETNILDSNEVSQSVSGVEKISIQEEMDKGKKMLDKGDYPEAKEIYLRLLGKIENKVGYETELSKIYNNLGAVAMYEDNLDLAVDFFNKAINLNTNFVIAIKNLSAVYLEKSYQSKDKDVSAKELTKAEEVIKPLINSSNTNPLVLQIWLKIINAKDGVKGIENYLKNDELNLKNILEKDEVINYTLGHIFLESHKLEEAEAYSEKCIELKKAPENYILRGRVYLGIALEKDVKAHQYSINDISPEFICNTNLSKANSDFNMALEIAQKDDIKILYGELSYLIKLVKTWLKEPVDENLLPKQHNLDESSVLGDQFIKVTELFRQREYSSSYTELKSMPGFDILPYEEIVRFARTYLYNGQPEIALELFLKTEQEAEKRKDFSYFLDLSMEYVLLGQKNDAIITAQKAKDYSKDRNRKVAFSHFGAVLLRYANEEGGDRLLENALQFNKEYPELHVIESQKVDEDLKQIIQMVEDQRKWADNIKDIFRKNPIPSYFLQKTFKKPYVSVWSGRDPGMPIEFTLPTVEFLKELESNFDSCDTIIPDYLSLLTLSKLDFLESLLRFGKKIKIPFSLFEKIQNELLQEENKDLRKLWDFLRRNNKVEIIKSVSSDHFKDKKMVDIFEKWLIDDFQLSKNKNTTLMTDDLRILKFSKSENINSINSWIVLQKITEKGWIDKVMYSRAIGKLAECFYSFISFTGKDLFTIIADDGFKRTARSFYLIDQINQPGSDIRSFSIVFTQFIEEIWKPGFVTEDKIAWLDYLTNVIGNITQQLPPTVPLHMDERTTQIVQSSEHFTNMWMIAIFKSNPEELVTLKEKLPEMIKQPVMAKVKIKIEEAIDKRIEFLKNKK
jgi:tetratricopeptide (TPR) repeat protein